MKTLTLIAFLVPTLSNATIWRVNNNPLFDPDHTDLQMAVDAASDNDTIHVEPSGTTYGTVVCDKVLVFIGPGFKLGLPDGNEGLQARSMMTTLYNLTLEANASGTVVQGLRFAGGGGSSGIFMNCVSAGIVGNIFEGTHGVRFVSGTFYSGVLIKWNYFDPSSSSNEGISEGVNATQTFADVLITNNIFLADIIFDDPEDSIGNVVIEHNVLAGNQYFADGSEFIDNIFTDDGAVVAQNLSNIHHNIAAGTATLPAGSNNVNGVDMATVFIVSASVDARWGLQPGVAATYPAADGTERGIFGGTMAYRLSGIPAIPSIYWLQQSGSSVLEGGTLNVTIGTRTND